MSTFSGSLRPRWHYRYRSWRVLLRRSLAGGEQDYTRGPIGRSVVLLAIPMILEMVMESIFAVTDIFFVSRLGPDAVATVGLTEATVTLIYAVAIGLSMAVTATVARRIGEKRVDDACDAAAQALWLGLLVGTAVGIIGATFASDVLRLMGASEQVIATGAGYTTILLGGSMTVLNLFLLNAVFRGAGDASIAMRSLWLANGINIVLDPLLIFGLGPFPEMGVTGAAVATTIGRGTGVVYQLWWLFGRGGRIRLSTPHLVPQWRLMGRMLKIAAGGIGQFIIATSSWIVLMRLMATFGSTAVAGYTIAIRVVMFTFLPSWGLSNAAATLVGQNLGAKRPERAVRAVWRTTWYNVGFMAAVAVIFLLCAEPIMRLFTDDPAVIEAGIGCLVWLAYGYPLYAMGMVMVQSLNGAGDTATPTKINFFCYWLLQIPLAAWLAQTSLGPTGVYIAIVGAESVMALVATVIFRRGRWQSVEV